MSLLLPLLLLSAASSPPQQVGRVGDLYVSNFNFPSNRVPGNDKVLEFDPGSGAFVGDFVASQPELFEPRGLVFGPDGDLYVCSYSGSGSPSGTFNGVLRYDGTTGSFLGPFADFAGWAWQAEDLAFGPDGDLYVVDVAWNAIRRFDGITGAYLGDFVDGRSGGLNFPLGLSFGPDGNLYVASKLSGSVKRYHGLTGKPLGDFVHFPFLIDDLCFGPDGNLYVSSAMLAQVRKVDGRSGVDLGAFATNAAGAQGIVFAGSPPDLFVNDFNDDRVLRYDGLSGAFLGVFADASDGLDNPSWITVKPQPRSYVLTVGDLQAGATPAVSLRGATPFAVQYLSYGIDGMGETPVPGLGVILNLSNPRLAASASADSSGALQWSLPPLPSGSSGFPVWIQGAESGRTTQVVGRVIL